MVDQLGIKKIESSTASMQPACAGCSACELNICRAAAEAAWASPNANLIPIQQSEYSAPARRIICRGQDLHDAVPIICEGWAASIVVLSDSSRQILSFLLPGDVVSTTLLFEPRAHYLVESITDIRYRIFNRTELKTMLLKQPDLFEKFTRVWIKEKARADELIIDLGRRTATERIARLTLSLVERLAKRGMARGEPIELEFPLRQHHIADATGLTSVHVSKVLSEFRRKGLIKISERSLTILDLAGFRHIANMR